MKKNNNVKVDMLDFVKESGTKPEDLKEIDYEHVFELRVQDHISHATIANQVALFHNEQLKLLPQYYKGPLKNKLNLVVKELRKQEKQFDKIVDVLEDKAIDSHDVYYDYIHEVASIPIWQAERVTDVLKALKKDPKSMLGITKKILKNGN